MWLSPYTCLSISVLSRHSPDCLHLFWLALEKFLPFSPSLLVLYHLQIPQRSYIKSRRHSILPISIWFTNTRIEATFTPRTRTFVTSRPSSWAINDDVIIQRDWDSYHWSWQFECLTVRVLARNDWRLTQPRLPRDKNRHAPQPFLSHMERYQ